MIYKLGSFEFIFSMDSIILLDVFHRVFSFLNLNYFFDTFFYFIYFDFVVLDSDTMNSQ